MALQVSIFFEGVNATIYVVYPLGIVLRTTCKSVEVPAEVAEIVDHYNAAHR